MEAKTSAQNGNSSQLISRHPGPRRELRGNIEPYAAPTDSAEAKPAMIVAP